jgi:hypothetical protein
MNVGAIIFDSRQGTTYMPIPTAMGEAYLYGEAVVMDDDAAIKTLQTQAAIRPSTGTSAGSVYHSGTLIRLVSQPNHAGMTSSERILNVNH